MPMPVRADVVVPVRADVVGSKVEPVRPGRRGRRQSKDESRLYSFRDFKFHASFVPVRPGRRGRRQSRAGATGGGVGMSCPYPLIRL